MANLFYTYVLFSIKHDRFYIGQTSKLQKRLVSHNQGNVKSTPHYKPWELVWYMAFPTRSEAMKRERKLKNLKSHRRLCDFMDKNGVMKLGLGLSVGLGVLACRRQECEDPRHLQAFFNVTEKL